MSNTLRKTRRLVSAPRSSRKTRQKNLTKRREEHVTKARIKRLSKRKQQRSRKSFRKHSRKRMVMGGQIGITGMPVMDLPKGAGPLIASAGYMPLVFVLKHALPKEMKPFVHVIDVIDKLGITSKIKKLIRHPSDNFVQLQTAPFTLIFNTITHDDIVNTFTKLKEDKRWIDEFTDDEIKAAANFWVENALTFPKTLRNITGNPGKVDSVLRLAGTSGAFASNDPNMDGSKDPFASFGQDKPEKKELKMTGQEKKKVMAFVTLFKQVLEFVDDSELAGFAGKTVEDPTMLRNVSNAFAQTELVEDDVRVVLEFIAANPAAFKANISNKAKILYIIDKNVKASSGSEDVDIDMKAIINVLIAPNPGRMGVPSTPGTQAMAQPLQGAQFSQSENLGNSNKPTRNAVSNFQPMNNIRQQQQQSQPMNNARQQQQSQPINYGVQQQPMYNAMQQQPMYNPMQQQPMYNPMQQQQFQPMYNPMQQQQFQPMYNPLQQQQCFSPMQQQMLQTAGRKGKGRRSKKSKRNYQNRSI